MYLWSGTLTTAENKKMLTKIALLSTVNLIGPLLVFFTTPALSRIYSPESIGEYYWILTLSMAISVVMGFQIFNQILSEKDDKKAGQKLVSNIILIFIISVFLGLVCLVSGMFVKIDSFSILVIASLVSINQVFSVYFSRNENIPLLAKVGLIRAVVISMFPIVVGMCFGDSTDALVTSYALAEFSILMVYVFSVKLSVLAGFFVRKKEALSLLKDGGSFAKYYLPSQLVSNFSNSAIIYLIKLDSVYLLGLYSMLYRLIGTPVYSVGSAVRSIFYIQVMKKKNRLYWLLILVSLIYCVSILLAALYFLLSLEFVAWFLGAEWQGIDTYIPFFILWFGASLANMLPAEILKHSGQQKKILQWEVFSAALKLTALASYYLLKLEISVLIFAPFTYFLLSVLGTVYFMKVVTPMVKYAS